MSLVGTLGKVAMGVIVAKGVGKMLGGSSGGSGGGLGGLLGGLLGGGGSNTSSGNSGGGLTDLIGGLAGKQGGGGLGGILDSLGDSNISQSQGGSLGDLFNNALQGKEPASVTNEEEENAKVLLRAMINAAKSDGDIDKAEQQKITEHLGDISEDEANFVRQELQSPLDTVSFINTVPRGMEQQVYLMSLLAIDLDSNKEAHYLDQLAKGLNISHQVSNQIHEKLGAPKIYA